MQTVILTATLAGLALAVPGAAQTTQTAVARVDTHKTPPRRVAGTIFVAVLSGGYAVPAVVTPATGTAQITRVGSRLEYEVRVDSISDVTGAYLHTGKAGEERPAVADLFRGMKSGPVSGTLAKGELGPAQLHDITMPQLIGALEHNDVYVTVHSLNQEGGEIRGQLRVQPMMASR